jgi:WhiB family redox-sensing transcriptional regulator
MTSSKNKDWRDKALCAALPDEIQELFFAEKDSYKTREAQAICFECEPRDSCLSFAMHMKLEAGVFGGMQPDDREAIKKSKSFSKKKEVIDGVRAEVALFIKHHGTT